MSMPAAERSPRDIEFCSKLSAEIDFMSSPPERNVSVNTARYPKIYRYFIRFRLMIKWLSLTSITDGSWTFIKPVIFVHSSNKIAVKINKSYQ